LPRQGFLFGHPAHICYQIGNLSSGKAFRSSPWPCLRHCSDNIKRNLNNLPIFGISARVPSNEGVACSSRAPRSGQNEGGPPGEGPRGEKQRGSVDPSAGSDQAAGSEGRLDGRASANVPGDDAGGLRPRVPSRQPDVAVKECFQILAGCGGCAEPSRCGRRSGRPCRLSGRTSAMSGAAQSLSDCGRPGGRALVRDEEPVRDLLAGVGEDHSDAHGDGPLQITRGRRPAWVSVLALPRRTTNHRVARSMTAKRERAAGSRRSSAAGLSRRHVWCRARRPRTARVRAIGAHGLMRPWRSRQRSGPDRETPGSRISRTTARRSSSGIGRVLRNRTTTTSRAGAPRGLG